MNKSAIAFGPKDLSYLMSPQAIRDRAHALYEMALDGRTHFRVREERLDEVADYVTAVTLANYPDLKIPFHSRWGHFQVGGVDRQKELNTRLADPTAKLSKEDRVRAKLDLAMVSVLLDAGSGPAWKYREGDSDKAVFARSEGLAVASFRMFMNGDFSSDPAQPLRADGKKLAALTLDELARGFQVSESNPLVGLEGRLSLLHALGRIVQDDPVRFPFKGKGNVARPGNLFDYCQASSEDGKFSAPLLLLAVLQGLGPIWPGRIQLGETNLGDVWSHGLLGEPGSVHSLIPFHKLSQWLTYSLIEPMEEAGLEITDVEGLTGLAEYRNGGLLLDRGLIELRDPSLASEGHRPDSALVVEWRALTIVLLEKLARAVRTKLQKTEKELPLAKVLEGGTWWAGRKAAAAKRTDGGPPLKILSDGTVF
jgi:hypothetical protein